MNSPKVHSIFTIFLLSFLIIPLLLNYANAENVPDWVKNTAKWYGDGVISETEFLNAIKFLIENDIIKIEDTKKEVKTESQSDTKSQTSNIIIPNGNANIEHTGFYIPLNLEAEKGTTVVWINDDQVLHTVQSIDEKGNIIGLFNSAPLNTGERFAYQFNEEGVYNYYCSLHPWRVGVVTIT